MPSCWRKVLQPAAPSKPTKATLNMRVNMGVGLKTRNFQTVGSEGGAWRGKRVQSRPPTLPTPRAGSSSGLFRSLGAKLK